MIAILRNIEIIVCKIAILANVSGTLVLLALVAIMNVDVVSRNLFHAPFRGVIEIVVFSMALIVFLQLPDVVRTGRLTRSDGFLALLQSRAPRIGASLTRLIDGVACVFMGLIVWTVWPEFVEAFASCHFGSLAGFGFQPADTFWADFTAALGRCHYFGTPGILTAPWWPVRLAIAFGCAWAAILFFLKTVSGSTQRSFDSTAKARGKNN